jgi:hypothetical protein
VSSASTGFGFRRGMAIILCRLTKFPWNISLEPKRHSPCTTSQGRSSSLKSIFSERPYWYSVGYFVDGKENCLPHALASNNQGLVFSLIRASFEYARLSGIEVYIEPDCHSICSGVNLSHQLNLMVSFKVIGLIYADSICPDRS